MFPKWRILLSFLPPTSDVSYRTLRAEDTSFQADDLEHAVLKIGYLQTLRVLVSTRCVFELSQMNACINEAHVEWMYNFRVDV